MRSISQYVMPSFYINQLLVYLNKRTISYKEGYVLKQHLSRHLQHVGIYGNNLNIVYINIFYIGY